MKYYTIRFPETRIYSKNECPIKYLMKKYHFSDTIKNTPRPLKQSTHEYMACFPFSIADDFIECLERSEGCTVTYLTRDVYECIQNGDHLYVVDAGVVSVRKPT